MSDNYPLSVLSAFENKNFEQVDKSAGLLGHDNCIGYTYRNNFSSYNTILTVYSCSTETYAKTIQKSFTKTIYIQILKPDKETYSYLTEKIKSNCLSIGDVQGKIEEFTYTVYRYKHSTGIIFPIRNFTWVIECPT
ncbi:MAG: hypothetical protein SH857_09475 [Chitinophagales bacterium]|nr:hypothetical protein [Chitinophagales bacterium]